MRNSNIPYIVLNAVRVLNIISILACGAAAGSLLAKTADLSIGWFNVFDLAEKVLVMLFSIFLLITEVPKLLSSYFARNWPLFGYASGFLTFSICLLFLGCDVLSYLCKEDADMKHIGADLYRMCQAAGLMAIIMSCLNLIATLVFSSRKTGLTARQVRAARGEFDDMAMA